MNHRTKEAYSHVFRFIEKNVFKLEPAEFITDFEAGMRSAINERWPSARLRGCWYHYSAALRKKMLKLGLHKLFKDSKDARCIKKMMLSLPLLPGDKFTEGYDYVQNQAQKWGLSKNFIEFFEYFKYWENMVIICNGYKNFADFRFPCDRL